jgi:salicylate hydroxylase
MSRGLLVVGGGIAGLASALALGRRGLRLDLLEQADSFGEVGAGVQLGPNATRRLRELGLGEALEGIAARPHLLKVLGATSDRVISSLALGDVMLWRYGAPYYCVHRADLHALLLDALRGDGRTALHTGARVAYVGEDARSVHVTADDGRAWSGEALVGADGLWSVVRPTVVGASAAPPRVTGHMAWRALVPQAALPRALRSGDVRVWLGSRLHAVAYPVRRGELLNVVVLAESDGAGDARDWSQATSVDALRHATGRCGRGLRKLIEAMPDWRAWTLCDLAPVTGPTDMARGRIALVGDAAHPMLPYMAQGAGLAIEDALALADALASPVATPAHALAARAAAGAPMGDVSQALGRYAQARWQRSARVQARARRNGVVFHLGGPARLARDLALRTLGGRLMDVPWLYGG